MDKEFEKLFKLMFESKERTLIRAEIKYSPNRLHATAGTNTELVKIFEKKYGIMEKDIDRLLEKYLKEPMKKLSGELGKMMIKSMEKNGETKCGSVTVEIRRKTEEEE